MKFSCPFNETYGGKAPFYESLLIILNQNSVSAGTNHHKNLPAKKIKTKDRNDENQNIRMRTTGKRNMYSRKSILSAITAITLFLLVPSAAFPKHEKVVPLFPLTIYRPTNTEDINDIRCWLKVEDMDGKEVTYTDCYASYAWIDTPNVRHQYQKTYYLAGGMAMHLTLKKGRYRITVYTPTEHLTGLTSMDSKMWKSNVFEYNTENPLNVLFVSPTANDNGFYTGGWWLDYRAPEYWMWTKPHRQ